MAQIAVGDSSACALTVAGGVKCWGRNNDGQLGDGTTTDRATPVDVMGLSSGVAQIAAGSGHTCAIMISGGAKCWGWNVNGQLGDGTIARTGCRCTPMPVDVSGLASGVVQLSGGAYHTCAVTTSGGLMC